MFTALSSGSGTLRSSGGRIGRQDMVPCCTGDVEIKVAWTHEWYFSTMPVQGKAASVVVRVLNFPQVPKLTKRPNDVASWRVHGANMRTSEQKETEGLADSSDN